MNKPQENPETVSMANLTTLLTALLFIMGPSSIRTAQGAEWVLEQTRIIPSNGFLKWKHSNNYELHSARVTRTGIEHSRTRTDWEVTSTGQIKKMHNCRFTFKFEVPKVLVPGKNTEIKATGKGFLSGQPHSFFKKFSDSVKWQLHQTDPEKVVRVQGFQGGPRFQVSGPVPGPINDAGSFEFIPPEAQSGKLIIKVELSTRAVKKLEEVPAIEWVYTPGEARKPELSRLTVKQRHKDYEESDIHVQATASYPDIGDYDTNQIQFTIRFSRDARTVSSRTFDAYDPRVKQRDGDLHLDYSFSHKEQGDYTVTATIKDSRYQSDASAGNLRFDHEDSLRLNMTVRKPVAEITAVNNNVDIMRNEPTTATAGLVATNERKYYTPRDPQILRTTAEMLGYIEPDSATDWTDEVWERVDRETSRFVYEGDRISLWGRRDPSLLKPTADMSLDELRKWFRSGSSSVVLEWQGGVRGEALWNPNKANYDSPNGGSFIVGASRPTSGNWKRTWTEWFKDTSRILATQFVSDKVTEAKDSAIDWFLTKVGASRPVMPGVPVPIIIFHLGAGDTLYDDLVYLRLESEVYVSTRDGKMKVFTFEGSPQIVDPKRNRKVLIKPGHVVTVEPGTVSAPQKFNSADLIETQMPAPDRPLATDSGKNQKDIPSLDANIVDFRFFEGPKEPPRYKQRRFKETFDLASTRYVFWHMELDYPKRDTAAQFKVETVWYKPDGSVFGRYPKQCRIDAGWSRSYYVSGWGTKKPGLWKPGEYRAEVYYDGDKIVSGSFTITDGKTATTSAEEEIPVLDFSVWPLEHKFDVALSRLSRAMTDADDETRRTGCERARSFVETAKKNYLSYRGPEGPVFLGSTDPADCPHGLMKTMRICAEDVRQTRANWMISSPPAGTDRAALQAQSDAIAAAEKAMDDALQQVLTTRGWISHKGPKDLWLQAPPQFTKFEVNNWPFALRVLGPDKQLKKAVIIGRRKNSAARSERQLHEQAVETHKKEHPELRKLESWRHWSGVPGHWFSYEYDFQDREIKALVYYDVATNMRTELRYLAPVDIFDAEECEEIIRSLRTGDVTKNK